MGDVVAGSQVLYTSITEWALSHPLCTIDDVLCSRRILYSYTVWFTRRNTSLCARRGSVSSIHILNLVRVPQWATNMLRGGN